MRFACNRCGKMIGDHDYTVHIIRHAFGDMERRSLIRQSAKTIRGGLIEHLTSLKI
jgi:hypothetical protein